MVTLKDVAKLAGVSHGTVSNVINGASNVSVDKIRKVKAAMAELGYKPNVIARNLKIEHTHEIDLILPNNRNQEYIELFDNLNLCVKRKGYSLNLKVTNEVPTEERRLLNESLMHNVEGVILITCQPSNEKFFDEIIKNGLKIIFVHHEPPSQKYNFVGLDVKYLADKILKDYLRQNLNKIAIISGPKEYSFEAEILNTYFGAMYESGISVDPQYIETCNYAEGNAFRSAMRILNLYPAPEVIFVTNVGIAKCVIKAIDIIYKEKKEGPKLVVLQPSGWVDLVEDETVSLPFNKLAQVAFEMILDLIQEEKEEVQRHIIKARLEKNNPIHMIETKDEEPFRVLLNESPSSEAVKLLLADFKKKTGIDVIVDTKPYEEIYDEIWSHRKSALYDVYSVDIPWLTDFVSSNMLVCLDDLYNNSKEYFERFPEDVLAKYAKIGNHFYGVPYSFTIQLLFYRRDLFNKLENQRLHYEWYKEPLKVPSTWEEFNKVAKLFTRKYNPNSDTEYGVTLGGRKASGAVNEYLPRLFSFGGNIFDQNRATIGDKRSVEALKNYVESYKYANVEATNWWWDEQVKEFSSGNVAMMIMYTEHVSTLEDKRFSKIVGKTECAILPEKYSVLGGWSLGINPKSKRIKESHEFMKWLSSYDLLGPNAALGRVLPIRDEEYRGQIDKVYSWFETAWEAYKYTKTRTVPYVDGMSLITEAEMEAIVGGAVHGAVNGDMTVVQALVEANQKLKDILK
jgi:DNA-binding LacI/PurR family transcriptional regulator/ABC-type glycerol-3-phosphate transport system substrate-binding protein